MVPTKRTSHKKSLRLAEAVELPESGADSAYSDGAGKLAEAISVLILPYTQDADSAEAFDNLVATACIAWNTANLPQTAWPQKIFELLSEMGELTDETRRVMVQLILALVDRKISLFPHDRRVIVGYKINKDKGSASILINSELPPVDG